MRINTNKGVIKAIRNKRVVIALPRGGTFTWKTDREFKVGEEVCFALDSVLQKVTDVVPKKEADDIVLVADNEAWGGVIGGINGLDLDDDDQDYEFENDNLEYLEEEDPIDVDNLNSKGQRFEGSIDFDCGERRESLIDEADYFGVDGPEVSESDGPTD